MVIYHLKVKESLDSYVDLSLILNVVVELVMVGCFCYLKIYLHASHNFGVSSIDS